MPFNPAVYPPIRLTEKLFTTCALIRPCVLRPGIRETCTGLSVKNPRRFRLWIRCPDDTKKRPRRVLSTPAPPASPFPSLLLRSEEHTSELQSLMRISYAVFCLKKKKNKLTKIHYHLLFTTQTVSHKSH